MAQQSLIRDFSDYTYKPFKFIVVESKLSSTHPALIYNTTENDIRVGLEGGQLKGNGRKYKGINELMDALAWHKENNKWSLPKEIYDSKGEITLDLFKPHE